MRNTTRASRGEHGDCGRSPLVRHRHKRGSSICCVSLNKTSMSAEAVFITLSICLSVVATASRTGSSRSAAQLNPARTNIWRHCGVRTSSGSLARESVAGPAGCPPPPPPSP
eukprot:TRINITY_DN915_c0_g1_i13.p2 TRINITY_DN915_c0_g1~~TRINITY_DN915_c0_g1_i13.p2  ORF type:complete len:112 (+),score=5.68 TRINITY_DN915_c0_g1_i13:131-466(+)